MESQEQQPACCRTLAQHRVGDTAGPSYEPETVTPSGDTPGTYMGVAWVEAMPATFEHDGFTFRNLGPTVLVVRATRNAKAGCASRRHRREGRSRTARRAAARRRTAARSGGDPPGLGDSDPGPSSRPAPIGAGR